ncbi:nitrate reductase molybdenum cofactor assembly chaperone [Catelliglobosispora koreensis]|uniref:nitrate reductase molybdenum cofactor assembly chaperone n=1 Tax=Catelliglobosispora koreensis TaxID=129052 RepID=UPI000683DAE9|nr:nitrate reductase molybdenum cofactor assembly chaperone [Catelliglobosispora koreensis]
MLLRYPDPPLLAQLPVLRAAIATLPPETGTPLGRVAVHRGATDPTALAAEYVELFDLRRRCCLYLSYYTAGDTRNRGQALLHFTAAYKKTGFILDGGELPDFLPAVLELAACAPQAGWGLLREHRIGLDLLATALHAQESVYAHAVTAIRSLLPPASPADTAAALDLARTGPPAETVGLQPFPLHTPTAGGRR